MSLSLEVAMMALLWDKILSTVQCCKTSDMILCCVKMVEHIDVKILSIIGIWKYEELLSSQCLTVL